MIQILFITDYVCPYCLVAKEALKRALAETGIAAEITIQPMELSPEGRLQVDTYSDPVRRLHYQILTEPARQLGLDMKLPPHIIPRPRTRLAFEGRCFAIENGKEEAYNDLMYKAYFIEELDIGNLDVLCSLAEQIGLDGTRYREMLEDGVYSDYQKEQNRISREEYNPEGIPTIYINGRKIETEAYTVAEMKAILASFEEAEESNVPADHGKDGFSADHGKDGFSADHGEEIVSSGYKNFMGCGPDGC